MINTDAVTGALVADAASLGLHWLYDQEQIARIETTGPLLFRAPDSAHYEGRQGYFAHPGKRSGDLSQYGEALRVVVMSLSADGHYDVAAHQSQFLNVFGPCGEYSGYADRPTKALVAKLLDAGDEVPAVTGMDDDQHPALTAVPALFSAGASLEQVYAAVSVVSTNDTAHAAAAALFLCLHGLDQGKSVEVALNDAAIATPGELGRLLSDALSMESYQPLAAANQFGMPCHVTQGLPVAWHILKHSAQFEDAVLDNIRCGGDSCGRAMAIGAVAGFIYGVPATLRARTGCLS